MPNGIRGRKPGQQIRAAAGQDGAEPVAGEKRLKVGTEPLIRHWLSRVVRLSHVQSPSHAPASFMY